MKFPEDADGEALERVSEHADMSRPMDIRDASACLAAAPARMLAPCAA
jgi:hypothetical protein